jgi:NADP-dependent 3-hydroxy acid dehydrogenase YdfG
VDDPKKGLSYNSGAGGAIGRGIARTLAKEGAKVMISDLDQTTLKETEQIIRKEGGIANAFVVDVTKEKSVKDWTEEYVLSILFRCSIITIFQKSC